MHAGLSILLVGIAKVINRVLKVRLYLANAIIYCEFGVPSCVKAT